MSLRGLSSFVSWGSLASGAFVLLVGCGGNQREAEAPRLSENAQVIDSPGETVAMPLTDLDKNEVAQTVDAGLGRFLQKVEIEADVREGKFQGFRIVRFTQPEEWRGVGLQVGDVVKKVNEQPIERPEQAYAVFASLKTASNLDVSYERDGKPMRLSLPIVDKGPPPAPSAAPAAATPTPPAAEVPPAADKSDKKKPADKKSK